MTAPHRGGGGRLCVAEPARCRVQSRIPPCRPGHVQARPHEGPSRGRAARRVRRRRRRRAIRTTAAGGRRDFHSHRNRGMGRALLPGRGSEGRRNPARAMGGYGLGRCGRSCRSRAARLYGKGKGQAEKFRTGAFLTEALRPGPRSGCGHVRRAAAHSIRPHPPLERSKGTGLPSQRPCACRPGSRGPC